MMAVGYVVNPTAGAGRAGRVWAELSPEGPVVLTSRPGEATEAAARFVAEGVERVVVFGGDGTLNEAARALLGSDVTLGLVAVGTGNDYARTLGLPTDPAAMLWVATSGPVRTLDAARVEDGAGSCRVMVNVAGVGFDAEVMTRFNAPWRFAKALPVRARYHLTIARTLVGYRPPDARVVVDGEELEIRRLLLLAVGNARFYGAGMMVLPDADPADGMLDVVWGGNIGPFEVARLLGKVDSGAHVRHAKVETRRCRSIRVEADRPVAYHVEGDVAGVTPITVTSLPGALRVTVPAPADAT